MKPKFLGPKVPHNPNSTQSKQIASSSSISINSTRYQDSPYFNSNESSSYTSTHSFNPSNQSNASTSCSPSSTSSTSSSSSSNQRSSNLSNETYFKEGNYDYDYQAHLNYLNYTNQQFHHQQLQNKLVSKNKQIDGMNMSATDLMKESLNKLNTISTNPNRFSSNNANNKANPSSSTFMLNPNSSNNSNTNQKLIEAIYTSANSNPNAGCNNKNDNLNPKTNLCNLKIFFFVNICIDCAG